jgi:polysaccharide pyruvyl transferase WcaK-like protein
MALHGAHATVVNRTLLTALTRALHRFASQTPTHFFYFIHSDGERGIAAALRRYGLPLTVVDGGPDVLLEAYRRLDVHICQMLHSAILATSVAVPTMAFAYDIKSIGYFNLLGRPGLCHDAANLTEDRIFAAINDLVAQRDDIAEHLARRARELTAESDKFYAQIAALVHRRPSYNTPVLVRRESCQ